MLLKDYLEKDISEFWASMPGGKQSMENPVARPVVDGEPAPITHTQPAWRTAQSLKQIVDPSELSRWYDEFGRQATPKLIGSIYAMEKDLSDDQMTKFYRR